VGVRAQEGSATSSPDLTSENIAELGEGIYFLFEDDDLDPAFSGTMGFQGTFTLTGDTAGGSPVTSRGAYAGLTSAAAYANNQSEGPDLALAIDSISITQMSGVEFELGDFDQDGDVDLIDLDRYIGNIGDAAAGDLAELDLDGDGTVGINDFQQHYGTLVQTSNGGNGTFAGDLNLDGTVNVLGDSWASGDLNADGTVNVLGDAFLLIGNLGRSNSDN